MELKLTGGAWDVSSMKWSLGSRLFVIKTEWSSLRILSTLKLMSNRYICDYSVFTQTSRFVEETVVERCQQEIRCQRCKIGERAPMVLESELRCSSSQKDQSSMRSHFEIQCRHCQFWCGVHELSRPLLWRVPCGNDWEWQV